jgi:hypothetical protein
MNKIYRLFSILVAIVLFLVSCSNITVQNTAEKALFQKYYDKANELLKANNLDGTPEMIFDRNNQGYKFYYLTIHSSGFSKLSQDEIAKILWTLYYVDKGGSGINYWIVPKVISNGDEYSYDDSTLHKNGNVWYAPSSPSSSSSTEGDFEMSWNAYNAEYDSLGGVVTIRKTGNKYTMKRVMPDGSSGAYDLTLISDNNGIKLTDRPGNSFGDYMLISSDGYLSFYDKQGLIYRVPPLK